MNQTKLFVRSIILLTIFSVGSANTAFSTDDETVSPPVPSDQLESIQKSVEGLSEQVVKVETSISEIGIDLVELVQKLAEHSSESELGKQELQQLIVETHSRLTALASQTLNNGEIIKKVETGVSGVAQQLLGVSSDVKNLQANVQHLEKSVDDVGNDVRNVGNDVSKSLADLKEVKTRLGEAEPSRLLSDLESQLRNGKYKLTSYQPSFQNGNLDIIRTFLKVQMSVCYPDTLFAKLAIKSFKKAEAHYKNKNFAKSLRRYGEAYRNLVHANSGWIFWKRR
jgi:archaellum component FlaC